MERAVINRFQKLTPTPAALIVVVAFALVALIDTATGPELSLSLFYLVPVALVSLRWRGAAGQLAALVAALAWVAIDLGSGATYSNPLIPFWNAAVRFGFFGLFSMLIERLQEAIEYQTSLARTDPLTGLPNRRSFEQSARRELARADRLRSRLALAIIDLDDFKLVNDEHGHAAGDRSLCSVATAAGQTFRSADTVARVGGDEFALLLPDVDETAALAALERFQASLLDDDTRPLSCSIGFVLVAGGDLSDALRSADQALYCAKASGKGAIELAEVPAPDRPPFNPK